MAKGEIARFEQFLVLLLCFQKAVCCRGVRKRLYENIETCDIFEFTFDTVVNIVGEEANSLRF